MIWRKPVRIYMLPSGDSMSTFKNRLLTLSAESTMGAAVAWKL